MNLRITKNGVIAKCESVCSAFTGSISGAEFANKYEGKIVQTTLSLTGYNLLSGKIDPEHEEGELRFAKYPSKFNVLVESLGWIECFTGYSE